MQSLIVKILASALGRWILGGLVAVGIGTAALMWHNHKEGLKEEGRLECVQEINQATIDALENELKNKDLAIAQLRDAAVASAQANAEAEARRQQDRSTIASLQAQMEEQKNEDPTYREWSDTDLPDGVADRLRQAAGSPPDSND